MATAMTKFITGPAATMISRRPTFWWAKETASFSGGISSSRDSPSILT